MALSSGAKSLLAEMAADHGLSELDFDSDGLIPVEIDGSWIAICYSEPRDSFFVMGVVAAEMAALPGGPWEALIQTARFATPRTRVAIEPTSGALVVVTELPVLGVTYPVLARLLETFLADFIAVRERYAPAGPPAAAQVSVTDLFASGEILIRV